MPSPTFFPGHAMPAPQPQAMWNVPQQPRPAPQQAWQAPPRQPMPALANLAAGSSNPGGMQPKIRGLNPQPTQPQPPTPPARLALPSPEELGIRAATWTPAPAAAPAAAPAVDWNQTHARLERLKAVRFQSDRLPQGGHRVMFLLPQGTQTHPVEASGATEAAAVQLALQQAEAWAAAQVR